MITVLSRGRRNTFEVNLLRNHHAAPRIGTAHRMLYMDPFVQLKMVCNDNGNPVQYAMRYKGDPPARNSTSMASIFYRQHNGTYSARGYEIVYNDQNVRLLKFGGTDPDYLLLALSPSQEDRAGDKRFSTIADTHAIEKDDGVVTVITGVGDKTE